MEKNNLKHLISAIELNEILTVKKYIKENKLILNKRLLLEDRSIVSPLSVACKKDFLPIVDLLLRCGADVNGRSGYLRNTELHYALQNYNMPLVNLLLSHNASPHEWNIWGESVLILTTSKNMEFMKKFLTLFGNEDLINFKSHKMNKDVKNDMLQYIDKLLFKNNIEAGLELYPDKIKKVKI